MAEYRKQIAYLDYLEDGVKIKNAGFVRIEAVSYTHLTLPTTSRV